MLCILNNRFDSFEEWYRSDLRGRMVQTLMQVSIQSLHVILQDIDMHDDKTVAGCDGTVPPTGRQRVC